MVKFHANYVVKILTGQNNKRKLIITLKTNEHLRGALFHIITPIPMMCQIKKIDTSQAKSRK